MTLNESLVEVATLEWFEDLGYAAGHVPQLAPGEPATERDSFSEMLLLDRQPEAIPRLNPPIHPTQHTIISLYPLNNSENPTQG